MSLLSQFYPAGEGGSWTAPSHWQGATNWAPGVRNVDPSGLTVLFVGDLAPEKIGGFPIQKIVQQAKSVDDWWLDLGYNSGYSSPYYGYPNGQIASNTGSDTYWTEVGTMVDMNMYIMDKYDWANTSALWHFNAQDVKGIISLELQKEGSGGTRTINVNDKGGTGWPDCTSIRIGQMTTVTIGGNMGPRLMGLTFKSRLEALLADPNNQTLKKFNITSSSCSRSDMDANGLDAYNDLIEAGARITGF